jgi:hypothetical protein
MAKIGKYCKSYKLSRLRQFPNWTERAENARRVIKEVNGETVEIARELTDEDYLYLHGDFTVTDGIFIDENVIFSEVTAEWIAFCTGLLGHHPTNGKPR